MAAALAVAAALAPAGPPLAAEATVEVADSGLQRMLAAASLTVAAVAQTDPAASAQDIVTAARADYANLLGVLYDEGHYGPVIHILVDGREAAGLSPFALPARVGRVVIRVDPGPRFRFGKAAVGPLVPGTGLPEGFAPGSPARAALIREAVGAAVDGWRGAGHAKAHAAGRRIVARHPLALLDAEVAIDPGPRLRFGRLIVRGNRAVRTDRIREIAGLRTGRVYSPRELDAVVRRLRSTGAFRSVALEEAERPTPDGRLDITASVVEQLPRRLGFGAELSSLEGLMLSGYWMHRNFLGGAEKFRVEAGAGGIGGGTGSVRPGGSGVDYSFGISLARPGTFSPANTLTGSFALAQEDEPDYYTRTALAGLALSRELNERTIITAALQYRFSDVEDALGERQMRHILLPLTGQIDARDDMLNPRAGHFLRLEIQPYAGLGGSESGARLYGDGRYYFSPGGGEGRLTLAGRLQFGTVLGSSLAGTPPDFLFYSGGGGTVRGQPYKSLRISLTRIGLGLGNFTGGRSFLGAAAEARVRVTGKIGIVGFYDWGLIGADPGFGAAQSHAGAGLGLRYQTPIGPIRLDVAVPVSGDTGDGMQLYLGIGQAF